MAPTRPEGQTVDDNKIRGSYLDAPRPTVLTKDKITVVMMVDDRTVT